MGKNQLILAHDIGTSGNKATLFNRYGEIIASETFSYQTYYMDSNHVEQNANDWWEAVCITSKSIMKAAKVTREGIACITFSGQMMGVVPVDKNANALRRAIIWADTRADEIIKRILEENDLNTLYRLTGNRVSSNYSAAKIGWLKQYEPTTYRGTYKFLQAKDFLVAKLTGRFATDYSDASGTNLLDIEEKQWSSELIDIFQLEDEKLPEILSSTTVAGFVHRKAAEKTGLAEGTPVVMGGADGSCAAMGAGVLEEGDIFNYIGSSSWISLASNRPFFDGDMVTFNFVHVDESKYTPIGTMQTAGSAIDWFTNHLYQEMKEGNLYEQMNSEASSSEIGANGLMFMPYLLGERSPWWNPEVRGAFLGLSINHTRYDMARAVLEGVSYNLKVIFDTFKHKKDNINEMWLFGGGANSELWCQMLADMYDMNIKVPYQVDETTSMGAAIVGGVGVGLLKDFTVAKDWCKTRAEYEPESKSVKKYVDEQQKFIQYYKALAPVYSKWS
ncbi:xylulokinase [Pseudogracilibacillus sp. SE30717A]|uniref:xylulokinase n=1 Tax=Pseudogracilibacillus sp. SE30717A TaxID=3098293 RepID=UPI00300DE86E